MTQDQALPGHNSAPADKLLAYIERIERLEEEKKTIALEIREVKLEARSSGFDVKAIAKIVKERGETDDQRRRRKETEDLADVYRAALGMLDGTPLGDSARERLMKPEDRKQAEDFPGDLPAHESEKAPHRSTLTVEDIAAARESGRIACREERRVIDNPYTAGDPRRAAWDEGWCFEAGSDGMDIPSAWRRSEKKKPAKKSDGQHGEQPDAPKDGEPGKQPDDGEE